MLVIKKLNSTKEFIKRKVIFPLHLPQWPLPLLGGFCQSSQKFVMRNAQIDTYPPLKIQQTMLYILQ